MVLTYNVLKSLQLTDLTLAFGFPAFARICAAAAASGFLVALYSSMAKPETVCFRMRVPLSVSSKRQFSLSFTVLGTVNLGTGDPVTLGQSLIFLGLKPFSPLDLEMLMELPRLRNREGLLWLSLERGGLDSTALGFSKLMTSGSISVPVFEQYSVKDLVDL